MKPENIQQIMSLLDQAETLTRSEIEANPKWDRPAEKVTDRLANLAAWIHDRTHDHIGDPAPPETMSVQYKWSMLRKFRKALGCEF